MKKFTSIFAGLALVVLANACGASKSEDKAATTTVAWTDTGMQAIVTGNCAISGCHNGTQMPNYSGISEAAMKADTIAKAQVSSGAMPQSRTLTAAQKATVAAFYAR